MVGILQEGSEGECGTALPTEVCLEILVRWGGMRSPSAHALLGCSELTTWQGDTKAAFVENALNKIDGGWGFMQAVPLKCICQKAVTTHAAAHPPVQAWSIAHRAPEVVIDRPRRRCGVTSLWLRYWINGIASNDVAVLVAQGAE